MFEPLFDSCLAQRNDCWFVVAWYDEMAVAQFIQKGTHELHRVFVGSFVSNRCSCNCSRGRRRSSSNRGGATQSGTDDDDLDLDDGGLLLSSSARSEPKKSSDSVVPFSSLPPFAGVRSAHDGRLLSLFRLFLWGLSILWGGKKKPPRTFETARERLPKQQLVVELVIKCAHLPPPLAFLA